MKFTIAIPTFNNVSTIIDAISSCTEQDFPEKYDIVVFDNASTDGTYEKVIAYSITDERIKVFRNSSTLNMWDNHNMCINNAEGDYILFCHSDDKLLPNALSKLKDKIEERGSPNKYVLFGHSNFYDFKPRLDMLKWNVGNLIVGSNSYLLFTDGGLVPSGTCYSTASFRSAGSFISDNNMVFPNSDSFTMLKLAFNGFSFEMLDDIIFERNISSSIRLNKKNIRVQKTIFRYMGDLLVKEFTLSQINRILIASCSNDSNFVYAYYISGIKGFKLKVLRILINKLIFSLKNIRKTYFLKTIRRYFIGY